MTFLLFGLWLLIRFKGFRNRLSKVFNLWVLTFLFWSLATALTYANHDPNLELFLIKSQYVTSAFIPAVFVLFSFIYPYKRFSISVFKRFLIFVPCILFVYLFYFTNLMLEGIYWLEGEKFYTFGKFKLLWDAMFIAYLLWGFLRFFSMFKNSSGVAKDRLRYVILGSLASVILAGIVGIIMPWFNRFDLKWLGPPMALVWLIYILYAIFKYQFMGIQIFVKKTTSLTINFTIGIILYMLFYMFYNSVFDYKPVGITLLALASLVLIYIPIKNIFKSFIENLFFKGSYFQVFEENVGLRQSLADSEKFKRLAYGFNRIITEMRNPLTALKGYGQFMKEKIDDEAFLMDLSKIVVDEVERIDHMVDHLTDYSHPKALSLKSSDVHVIIDNVLDILKDEIDAKEISVIKKFKIDKNTHVDVDPTQLQQAFLDVIYNAVQAIEEKGVIEIKTSKYLEHFQVSIKDNGCGIAEEDMAFIFDPFYSKKKNCIGLGLATTKTIIDSHNGHINVKSEKGQGCEVIMSVPLRQERSLE